MMSNYLPGSDCQVWMSQSSYIQNDGWARSWTSSLELTLKLGADVLWFVWIGSDFATMQMVRPTTAKVQVLSPSHCWSLSENPFCSVTGLFYPLLRPPQGYSDHGNTLCALHRGGSISPLSLTKPGLIWRKKGYKGGRRIQELALVLLLE